MATGPGRTTRRGRVRRAAVRRAGCDGRGARPCLIGGLVDCRPHRRREPGTGLRHLGPMRCGHIPRERENYPYQHRADCRGEPRPTAGAGEPPWSRLSTHDIFPSHGNAAYQRAEAARAGVIGRLFLPLLERCPRPGNGLLPAGHRGHIRRLSRRVGAHDACRLSAAGRHCRDGRVCRRWALLLEPAAEAAIVDLDIHSVRFRHTLARPGPGILGAAPGDLDIIFISFRHDVIRPALLRVSNTRQHLACRVGKGDTKIATWERAQDGKTVPCSAIRGRRVNTPAV